MSDQDELLQRIARMEGKLDLLVQMVAASGNGMRQPKRPGHLEAMTTKQHAALQMLLGGASNADIAVRFGVSENTAKVYVRSIAAKLGVNTRNQIIVMLYEEFHGCDDDEYRLLSGGLPKDWHENYEEPDAYRPLYATKTR